MSEDTKKKIKKVHEVKETFQALLELSHLLNTGLDSESLAICVRLCQAGINPDVLAMIVRDLQKEVELDARTKHEQAEQAQTKHENATTNSEHARTENEITLEKTRDENAKNK